MGDRCEGAAGEGDRWAKGDGRQHEGGNRRGGKQAREAAGTGADMYGGLC